MQILTERVLRITGIKEAAMAALSDISEKCLTVLTQTLRIVESKPESASSKKSQTRPSAEEMGHLISPAARNGIKTADLDVVRSTTGVLAKFTLAKPAGKQVPRTLSAREIKLTLPCSHQKSLLCHLI
jgi:hypothetical protein